MNRTTRAAQGGFSLIELLVGLALLTLLAVAISGAFDGSRSRAQALLSMMSELGSAQAREKNDTGCYLNKPLALFDATTGKDPANNYCARSQANTWNGPYVTRFTADNGGNVVADKVAEGVVVSFPAPEAGGMGKRYFITATGVPEDIARQTLQECNNKVDLATMQVPAAFNTYKCRSVGIGNGPLAQIDMIYDETR